jgi:CRISPR-associated endonuclease/helicase Cas3
MTSVYQRMLLLRTWAVLRDKREVRSPEQVPELVDAVYAPSDAMPCPPGWEEQWRKAAGQLERARENDKHDAREIYAPQPWDDQDIGKLTTRPKSPRRTRKERGRR